MELMTYKCPNCGGAITFESGKQEFKCEYCDSVFTKEQLSEYDEILRGSAQPENTKTVEEFDWSNTTNDSTLENVNAYICQYCGAQVITDKTTAATECPYCNSPVIVAPQLSGGLRPDVVIPFKIKKEEAEKALQDFYKGKLLLPKEFKTANKIREIKGVYIPFWLYDCTVGANVTYNASKVTRWRDSNYEYTKTDRFKLLRSGSLAFEKIPVDGSSKMDDAYMDAIEPFNYAELIDFDAAYLSGYMADRYDVTLEQNAPRINSRIEATTLDTFRQTVSGYSGVTPDSKKIGIYNGKAKYALLPVWILNTKYQDKTYTFAMNGQTGKLVGSLPVDKKKYWGYLAGIAAGLFAISQLFVFFGG